MSVTVPRNWLLHTLWISVNIRHTILVYKYLPRLCITEFCLSGREPTHYACQQKTIGVKRCINLFERISGILDNLRFSPTGHAIPVLYSCDNALGIEMITRSTEYYRNLMTKPLKEIRLSFFVTYPCVNLNSSCRQSHDNITRQYFD